MLFNSLGVPVPLVGQEISFIAGVVPLVGGDIAPGAGPVASACRAITAPRNPRSNLPLVLPR